MSAPTHAEILNACSDLLESYGARPVPRVAPDWTLPKRPGRKGFPVCACGHVSIDHGATGECWNVDDGICPCDQTEEIAA